MEEAEEHGLVIVWNKSNLCLMMAGVPTKVLLDFICILFGSLKRVVD